MIHEFSKSLEHERSQSEKANNFYSKVLNATNIVRFNTDSISDMEMQRKDIDVQITVNGITYRVSEKFRDKDFGDLYIEVYSKYPKRKGWMHTGNPDALVYFTPKYTYWITHKSLHTFCLNTLFPAIPDTWFHEIFVSEQPFVSKKILLNKTLTDIKIIQARNFEGNFWSTIGIGIKFDVLERFDVKIRKF